MPGANHEIIFFVNGESQRIADERGFMPLADFLRYELRKTGTKIVCAEGDCGSCSVLIGSTHNNFAYKAANACILPVYAVHGCHVISVEGIGNSNHLHPVQQALVESFGSQCGYCTPGFVVAMVAMVEEVKRRGQKNITEKKAKNYLTGNLCRCTGYEPIVQAAMMLSPEKIPSIASSYSVKEISSALGAAVKAPVEINLAGRSVFLPTTLDAAIQYKASHPQVRITAGSTDCGVVINKGRGDFPHVMTLHHVADLRKIQQTAQEIVIGGAVTLSEMQEVAENKFPEFGRMLHIFASPQIKNQATLAGNIVNASPIADGVPMLVMQGAVLELVSARGKREVLITSFYRGYKDVDLQSDEFLARVRIPLLTQKEIARLYKVSRRKDLDISAVTVAIAMRIEGKKIQGPRLAVGGVAATIRRVPELEKIFEGKTFSREVFIEGAQKLAGLIKPLSDVRGEAEYRQTVCQNLLLKFHDEVKSGAAS